MKLSTSIYVLCMFLSSSLTTSFTTTPNARALFQSKTHSFNMFSGGDGKETSKEESEAPAFEFESKMPPAKQEDGQKIMNFATGQEIDAKFQDPDLIANSKFELTWGWVFLLYPIFLFLNDQFQFFPTK